MNSQKIEDIKVLMSNPFSVVDKMFELSVAVYETLNMTPCVYSFVVPCIIRGEEGYSNVLYYKSKRQCLSYFTETLLSLEEAKEKGVYLLNHCPEYLFN